MKPAWETYRSLDTAFTDQEVKKLADLMKRSCNWAKIGDSYYTPEEFIRDAPYLKPAFADIKQVNPYSVLRNGNAHIAKLRVQLDDFEKRVKEYFKLDQPGQEYKKL